MGVVVSYLLNIKDSDYNPTMNNLTTEEIELIKTTWLIPKSSMIDSGEAILMRFLEKHPENQNKFNAFRNVPLLSLKGTPGFRTHGLNIMKIFDKAIDSFDKENSMEEFLQVWTEMGGTHSKRKISKKSFLQIRDVILEILTGVCDLDQEQQRIWMIFFDNSFSIVMPILMAGH